MYFNLWSILLIAFLSQCVFLLVSLIIRPSANKNARQLLMLLLVVIFCVLFGNFCEATYLYRKWHGITNLGRGMLLLQGPVLYLYTLSVISADFKFRYTHLLHFLPYFLALAVIWRQENPVDDRILVLTIDAVMEGKSHMDWKTSMWFVTYFVHLTVYFLLIRRFMLQSVKSPAEQFQFPIEQRLRWLKKLTITYSLVALVFLGIIFYISITGLYTVYGNFIYAMALGGLIYTIAFQALPDWHTLKPGFDKKYKSINIKQQTEEELLNRILYFFEQEKIFMNPDLRIDMLAKKTDAKSNVVSKIINKRLGKSFSEAVNYYRIEEVKKRLDDPKFDHHSIFGIAMDVGFTSKSAFNETFKKLNGITPSQYVKLGQWARW
ncbi:helix-turn-helix domain-containing protein [Mucilaginibacter flavidus]|uniref:helix-turn-helix domain-containing protein n=1 Tax=Mucilaginibacter flavidus TaxID=2949309 RepID=UPI00209268BD|nr:helix-turn-helix domain-containing protein [Mucilaginibacter flavidus]MCO5950166.1 helix-turn-helix domain-containing protein [Mucilaginibacter flavidus]